jgi:glucose/arabinose dehydrogenase
MLLALAGLAAAGGFACSDSGASEPSPARTQALDRVNLTWLADGLTEPTALAYPGDGSGRLFITERGGAIRIFDGRVVLARPFLDLTDRVLSEHFIERGLVGLAFHPEFATNGYFYIAYTRRGGGFGGDGDVVLAEYRVSADDPDIADASSENVLLVVDHFGVSTHNGGHLVFGPDGHLYAGLGDADPDEAPEANAQNTNLLVGTIIRVDVGGGGDYTVPASNPFVGKDAADEIWAYGLRNPWRFSFDRATGDLYIGDVGEAQADEVNIQPASSAGGENYGWPFVEGTRCGYPREGCDPSAYITPVLTYDHTDEDCAVVGGHVYRGEAMLGLAGAYVFGDFCSGRVWAARNEGDAWQRIEILRAPFQISTFAEDDAGEILVAAFDEGALYRLTPD